MLFEEAEGFLCVCEFVLCDVAQMFEALFRFFNRVGMPMHGIALHIELNHIIRCFQEAEEHSADVCVVVVDAGEKGASTAPMG